MIDIDVVKLISEIGECEILCQLAEEASELAKAALKLRRAIDGTNPTPKSVEECEENLREEAADVDSCLRVLRLMLGWELTEIIEKSDQKITRWGNRIRERKDGES